ncbi:MAG: NUDIX domain-containing protein [Patescibacteria group bacterium]
MRTAINTISFRDGGLLLVKKKRVWILPGGKPKGNETDLQCLLREGQEELPNAQFQVKEKYKDFIGKTPHSGDLLTAKVYFAKVAGSIVPSAEISDSQFITKDNIKEFPLSEITQKIVESLIGDKLF